MNVAQSSRLRSRRRGAVLVEYMAVWGLVAIGATLAIIALGPALLTAWGATKTALLANKP
jgi:hypothetical protein